MKHLIILLSLLPTLVFAQAPAAGSLSDPVTFAVFSGATPVDSSLSAHAGKIVVLVYYTHW
jgi:hypothetical protein